MTDRVEAPVLDLLRSVLVGLGALALACGKADDATSLTPRPCPDGSHRQGPGYGACVPDMADADAGDTADLDASGSPTDAQPPAPDDASVALPDGGAFCPPYEDTPCDPRAYSSATRACAVGSLQHACAGMSCPTLEQAVERLRAGAAFVIVRRTCRADDGTPLISVGSSSGTSSSAYVYEAQSGGLLAIQIISDSSEFCGERTELGYYGGFFADCGFDYASAGPVPDACSDHLPLEVDAGLLPEICVLSE